MTSLSEQQKYIVDELNNEPFSKGYNLISFDGLSPGALLQVLNDILAEIEPRNNIDIREEDVEQTVIRMLNMLQMIKYKPPDDLSVGFRRGLIEGDKAIIYHVAEWLLRNIEEVKKRAYLARYLVVVDVPEEMRGDVDVDDLFVQYEALVEEFKTVHKERENMRNSGFATTEMRKDIEAMENERDIVVKKLERLQRKVDDIPNKEQMLEIARELRLEKEKEREISAQVREQRNIIAQAEHKVSRLKQQLAELRQPGTANTPDAVVKRLEEELRVSRYLVEEKLPREIEENGEELEILQRVVGTEEEFEDDDEDGLGTSGYNTEADLEALEREIETLASEIGDLVNKKLLGTDGAGPVDDKLALFRQQVAIVGRKKENLAEMISEAKSELSSYEEEEKEKRYKLLGPDADTKESAAQRAASVDGESFRAYVAQLRGKSTVYKQHRAQIGELRSEMGVLSRTIEILQSKQEAMDASLNAIEQRSGVAGFRTAKEETARVSTAKASLDQKKGETLEEMSATVVKLTNAIAERKAQLAPMLKELRALRQQHQQMQSAYDSAKHTYDATATALQAGTAGLEREVKALATETSTAESKFHLLEAQHVIQKVKLQKIAEEVRGYLAATDGGAGKKKGVKGKSSGDDGGKSMRDKLLRLITEQEKRARQLREDQKKAKELQPTARKQAVVWKDLDRLFDCKQRCIEISAKNAGIVRRESGAETLVLQ